MKRITHCRACGSKALTPAFSLEKAAPAVSARIGGALIRRGRGDVDFVFCDPSKDARACGLLQSAYKRVAPIAPPSPSSRYATVRAHLRAVATEALELISGRDCAALDIGCSDGALLSFYPRWVERFGVDPNEAVETVGEWAWTAREAFPSPELDAAFGEKHFDIVTAVSALEEVDEPRALFRRVKELLAPDGVFAVETLYAPMTLTRNGVEAFIGGAAAVYSLGVLERLARDSGLKIFRGALTGKEGGSIRLFLTHEEAGDHDFDPWYERLARLWDEENALSLRALQPYQAFEQRARLARGEFVSMLKDIAARGESVHLLGASAPSAAMLAWAGESAGAIRAVVDEGPSRGDAMMAGLPVISETECRAAEPDYLLAPAPLKREMMERWRESVLLGARIIVATPEPHVIHTHNFAAEYAKTLAEGDSAGGVETLRGILIAAGRPRLVAERPAAQAASA
ncbi:MAG: class I SAM-dependent methyltransferase [Pseudomonadota bacterium]|nr:class I SAM-dependent methyltransferase [Pseudomonadota bacterium]